DRSRPVHPANDDIRPPVAIEIRHRQRVGLPPRPRKLYGISEVAPTTIGDHVGASFSLLDDCQVQPTIAIKIGGDSDPDPGRTRPYLGRGEEMAFPIVP